MKSMTWTLADGTTLTMRRIDPADADKEQAFVRGLSPMTRHFRFHGGMRELSSRQLHALTHLDPKKSTALIVLFKNESNEEQIAVARYIVDASGINCEFAVVVADTWQRRGIGVTLVKALIQEAQEQGLVGMFGTILRSNGAMREFSKRLGFTESTNPEDPSLIGISKILLLAKPQF